MLETEVQEYLPKSLRPFVLSSKCSNYSYEPVKGENKGEISVYWIYLSPGWQWCDTHVLSGPTVKDVLQQIKEVTVCKCSECLKSTKKQEFRP